MRIGCRGWWNGTKGYGLRLRAASRARLFPVILLRVTLPGTPSDAGSKIMEEGGGPRRLTGLPFDTEASRRRVGDLDALPFLGAVAAPLEMETHVRSLSMSARNLAMNCTKTTSESAALIGPVRPPVALHPSKGWPVL
ncbi:hypothetical protein [Nocardiopsis sp. ATB16-24]|uniref:hypothetical protein n=1 Tax=Nocardiopsis sp. ATB16-24 TaxID=3019555 RepID=UPI002553FF5C|nr:hypothetical protein [Nocardiopsis sp. ATB16-24]